jgi:hypothetical protein
MKPWVRAAVSLAFVSSSSLAGCAATNSSAADAATSAADAAPSPDAPSPPADAAPEAPPDAAPAQAVPCVVSAANVVSMTRGQVRIDYDLTSGLATVYTGGAPRISQFYAGVQLASYTTNREYTARSCTRLGDEYVVTSTKDNQPSFEQHFYLEADDHFLTRVIVKGGTVSTSWISPLVMSTHGGLDIGASGDARVLWVPYDNDAWVAYNAMPINNSGTSYEAAAFYDNATRQGIVVGSVTHDTWKTGVYYAGSENRLDALNVFGGAGDGWSHDVVPHGKVSGPEVASPLVFVAAGPDWRDLMEAYADANVRQVPRLAWSGGVPFGWNSWGKLQSGLTYDKAIGASDFIKNELQGADFASDGVVYVNLDSYWDNLSDAQLAQFVARCHANGQKAGIYWTPFVDWGKSASRQVEGTSYTYDQIWLRNANGQPIELDGAYAVDPTHPGTRGRIDTFIDKFKAQGFEYVKLDFLSHGALESTVRFDPAVQTGTQAYNSGMAYLRARIGGSMFISESIAPLFPYQYAHARRVACDTFGAATGQYGAEYELNSVSYGWWMNGKLYRYNDPDSMVFEGFTANDNMTRMISAVISGTVFLNGDDLTSSAAQALARTYLTNPRMNAVARLGRSFRPVEGNTSYKPSDTFVLVDGASTYLATFNFGTAAVTRPIDLARAGLDASRSYSATDLWSNATTQVQGTMSVSLAPGFARLYRLQ